MTALSEKERVDVLIQTIQSEFPDAIVEFSTRTFPGHVELWVYVTKLNQYSQVEELCRSLEQQEGKNDPTIWIFAQAWTGPWPGGESEQELKRRREEFKRQHGLSVGAPA